MVKKREQGQYFTRKNIFHHEAFYEWALKANLQNEVILEPFAGSNSIIQMLKELDLCREYKSFDINPQADNVKKRNTLMKFPKGYNVIVTNPPYLAKNSATRRGLPFIDNKYDDLYKYSLLKCLENSPFVAAIVPASFLNSQLFRDRLAYYISLPYKNIFLETFHPVCLALFEENVSDTIIYEKDKKLGLLNDLEKFIPIPKKDLLIEFNNPYGNIGLKAIDNTIENNIYFMEGKEICSQSIKPSSRSLTRINISHPIDLEELNFTLETFRNNTHDIFLTPFKGIRHDGKFRRRIDFTLVRKLVLSIL